MAQNIGTFSLASISLIIAGHDVVSFIDSESAISIEADADFVTAVVGASGSGVFNLNQKPMTITFTLMANSPSNTFLSALVLTSSNLPTTVPVPFTINDINKNVGVVMGTGMITRPPNMTLGTSGQQEWKLVTMDANEVSIWRLS